MKNRSQFVIALLAALLLVLTGCGGAGDTSPDASGPDAGGEEAAGDSEAGEDEQASGEPIPIGVLFAQTGAVSALGVSARFGALSAVEYVNAQGGVNGRPLEASFCDDGGDEARAVTCVRDFVDEGVVAIIGPITSPLGLATAPISGEAGIPQFALGSATGLTEPTQPYLFRVSSGTEEEYALLKDWVDREGFERVALLSDNNAFGQDAASIATRIMGELGVEIVATETFETSDTDMTSQLTRIRGTDAELIVMPATAQGGGVILRNHAALGMDIPIVTGSGLQTDAFIELAGAEAEGVLRLTGWKVSVFDTLSEDDPLYDAVSVFIEHYEGDTRPDPFSALAWDAVMLAAEGLRTASDMDDPESVRDAIESIDGLVGATSTWDYGPDNHRGNDSSGLFMAELVDGNWVALE